MFALLSDDCNKSSPITDKIASTTAVFEVLLYNFIDFISVMPVSHFNKQRGIFQGNGRLLTHTSSYTLSHYYS